MRRNEAREQLKLGVVEALNKTKEGANRLPPSWLLFRNPRP